MLPARYRNGNCEVHILMDGTKTRTYIGTPRPVYPESIDLKITNRCAGACSFCHECSIPAGQHADVHLMADLLMDVPINMEVAIGGGDPMTHPYLLPLLTCCRRHIYNITVSSTSYSDNRYVLMQYRMAGLVSAVGVTYEPLVYDKDPGIVFHYIMGVHQPWDMLNQIGYNYLILGYKEHGRAPRIDAKILENIGSWRYFLDEILRKRVSFDNLAIEQLQLKKRVPKSIWAQHYMGNEGQFSMYIDAVERQYAVNSTSKRYPCKSLSIKEMFAKVRSL